MLWNSLKHGKHFKIQSKGWNQWDGWDKNLWNYLQVLSLGTNCEYQFGISVVLCWLDWSQFTRRRTTHWSVSGHWSRIMGVKMLRNNYTETSPGSAPRTPPTLTAECRCSEGGAPGYFSWGLSLAAWLSLSRCLLQKSFENFIKLFIFCLSNSQICRKSQNPI